METDLKLSEKNNENFELITSVANPELSRLPSPLGFDITRLQNNTLEKIEEKVCDFSDPKQHESVGLKAPTFEQRLECLNPVVAAQNIPKITFISIYEQDIETYKTILGDYPNFCFVCGDVVEEITTAKYDTIVSPANSFGFMESGIDSYYLRFFGNDLQIAVQNVIKQKYHGELPVGRGMLLKLKNSKQNPKYFMVAPTMRSQNDVSNTINAYLSFKAILEVVEKTQLITSILVPCLATGIGRMNAKKSAKQIKMAMDAYLGVLSPDHNTQQNTTQYNNQPTIFDIHQSKISTLIKKNTEFMLAE